MARMHFISPFSPRTQRVSPLRSYHEYRRSRHLRTVTTWTHIMVLMGRDRPQSASAGSGDDSVWPFEDLPDGSPQRPHPLWFLPAEEGSEVSPALWAHKAKLTVVSTRISLTMKRGILLCAYGPLAHLWSNVCSHPWPIL